MGEFKITALVPGVMACPKSSRSIWKSSVLQGTTLSVPPAFSTNTRYSGKNGEKVINSSPSTAMALRLMVREAAAPTVM